MRVKNRLKDLDPPYYRLWTKYRKLWNNKKNYTYFTVNGAVRIKQVENGPYKNITHVNDLRALFPVEQISMSWVFRYLQAVVLFLNCVHWFLLAFAFCSWQYSGKAFFSRSFRWPLLFASLLRLFVSFRCSATFYCFRDVQIIMSVNINQMINKNNSSILL